LKKLEHNAGWLRIQHSYRRENLELLGLVWAAAEIYRYFCRYLWFRESKYL